MAGSYVSRTALHGVTVIPPLCDMPEVIDEPIAARTRPARLNLDHELVVRGSSAPPLA